MSSFRERMSGTVKFRLPMSVAPNLRKGQRLDRIDDHPSGYRHYRTITGAELPSVTTVLSLSGVSHFDPTEWIARVGEEEARRITAVAANRGTAFHAIMERLVLGEEVELKKSENPSLVKIIGSVLQAITNRIDAVRGCELMLHSEVLGVAGTADLFATFDGVPSVIDWKNSRQHKTRDDIEHYFVQCTIYAELYERAYGERIDALVVVMYSDEAPEPLIFKEPITDKLREKARSAVRDARNSLICKKIVSH